MPSSSPTDEERRRLFCRTNGCAVGEADAPPDAGASGSCSSIAAASALLCSLQRHQITAMSLFTHGLALRHAATVMSGPTAVPEDLITLVIMTQGLNPTQAGQGGPPSAPGLHAVDCGAGGHGRRVIAGQDGAR